MERSSSTIFHSSRSSWRPAPFGLSQGSVLGPLLYILFTADVESLLASCSLMSHSYADDIQSYTHCSAFQAASAVRTMSYTTDCLSAWMSSNCLRLSPSKTQYIWIGTRQQLDKLDLKNLSAEFPTFAFSTSVRNLGVILDQELYFTGHITALTRSCYYTTCASCGLSLALFLLHLPSLWFMLLLIIDWTTALRSTVDFLKSVCILWKAFCGRLLV